MECSSPDSNPLRILPPISTERRWREETAGEEPPTNASEFETPKGTAEMEVDPIEPPTDASKIESRKGTSDMEEDSESEKETPKETKIDKTELAREAERENDPTEGVGGLNGSGEASIDAVEGRDGPETEEPPRETENVIVMEKGIVSSRSVACVSSSSLLELASTIQSTCIFYGR
ncbi:predicted protein [Arabidopsis lyrata subsp. lyrata]|uniref:Predicted protein n=1 Tax=Arabidopsis lyrata subsp. lyrata TaxID=81972 RepID=D7L5A6_ARALL|nr:predicted protein [Arabidopsis lyrata subsp. lyrata]